MLTLPNTPRFEVQLTSCVQDDKEGCDDIGFVVKAPSIEDIADAAADHGGTHFRILDDLGARSAAGVVKRHKFTARVFRCSQ